MKPERHPHPKSDTIQCQNCRFWHPDYVNRFRIYPDGQLVQEKQARAIAAQGVRDGQLLNANYWTANRSMCFRHPTWAHTDENHYCAEFESHDKRS